MTKDRDYNAEYEEAVEEHETKPTLKSANALIDALIAKEHHTSETAVKMTDRNQAKTKVAVLVYLKSALDA